MKGDEMLSENMPKLENFTQFDRLQWTGVFMQSLKFEPAH